MRSGTYSTQALDVGAIFFVVEALGMKYVLILYHWVERCFEHDGRCSDSEGTIVLQKVQECSEG